MIATLWSSVAPVWAATSLRPNTGSDSNLCDHAVRKDYRRIGGCPKWG